MNPQHAIVSGLGAMPADSVGNRGRQAILMLVVIYWPISE